MAHPALVPRTVAVITGGAAVAAGGAADVEAIETDVSVPGQMLALEGAVGARFGGADVLMNNAGIQPGSGVFGPAENWRRVIDGNLWAAWGHRVGVKAFSPDGTAIGRIALPERCANLCFGGRARNRLFMAAGQSLYAAFVATRGA